MGNSNTIGQLVEALKDAQHVLEIADRMADELSLLSHTTGISRRGRDALSDYDGPRLEQRRQTRAAIEAATALA